MPFVASIHLHEEEIARRLNLTPVVPAFANPPSPGMEPPRPAAVLVPLIHNPIGSTCQGWHILYTRRTELVQDHKGQVSFPGGRADAGDASPIHTALREASEEIGLNPADVRILGQMSPFLTITNYLVTPVIGIIPWPYQFTLQPQEVSRVFTIPMDWMARTENYEIRQRDLPPAVNIPPQFQHVQVIYFHQYDGETLWGVTAEVTLRFLKLMRLAQ